MPKLRLTAVVAIHALVWLAVTPVELSATTVVPPEFPELVHDADFVVRAKVKRVSAELRQAGNNRIVVSRVVLEVTEVIAGRPPVQLELEVLGGSVGGVEMTVQGAPQFAVGDDDILFVQGNGRQIVPLVRMMHGRYPVRREAGTGREYVARDNGVPLQTPSEVVLPMTSGPAATLLQQRTPASGALSPAEFIRQIREVREPGAVHAKQK